MTHPMQFPLELIIVNFLFRKFQNNTQNREENLNENSCRGNVNLVIVCRVRLCQYKLYGEWSGGRQM